MRRYSDLKALPTDAEHEKEAIQEENRGSRKQTQFHELNLKGGQMEKSDLRVKQVSFSPPPVKEKKKKKKKKFCVQTHNQPTIFPCPRRQWETKPQK